MKRVLLFRHFESQKNTDNKFSSEGNQETLTSESVNIIEKHSAIFDEIICDEKINAIYCSDSKRAIDSARLLTNNKIEIKPFVDFNSIKYNSKGLSENEVKNSDPAFMDGLFLYRKGLFSSYLIPTPTGSENVAEFEKRVNNKFNAIIQEDKSNLVVFFLHRSPITSILINFARKYYSYPKDYFGYVELDLGKFSLLNVYETHGEIKFVNESIHEIKNIFKPSSL